MSQTPYSARLSRVTTSKIERQPDERPSDFYCRPSSLLKFAYGLSDFAV